MRVNDREVCNGLGRGAVSALTSAMFGDIDEVFMETSSSQAEFRTNSSLP
jgi:hypothetical protein